MPPKIELVYWDSVIWIAWLMNEKRANPEDMEGVNESARKIKCGEQRLLTSSIIHTELSFEKMGDETKLKFTKFLQRKSQVFYRNFDQRAGELARKVLDSHRGMEAVDAQHLAMAILYNVDAFYTFDEGKKGGMNLLKLSGNVAGHPLLICKPPPPTQKTFDWNAIG